MTNDATADVVWTIPNRVSFARILILLPLSLALIASGYYGWSLVSLTLLGLTDGLDGALARKLNQTSKLGEELDPVSDRASVLLVSLGLVFAGVLPWQLFAVILGADLLLLALGVAWFNGYPPTHVNLVGKIRTTVLLFGLPFLLLAAALHNDILRAIGLVIVTVGVALHCVAAVTYIQQMVAARRRILA